MTEPAASSTARLTKFSDAISSSPLFWRRRSLVMAAAISGSASASERQVAGVVCVGMVFPLGRSLALLFRLADLIDAPLVASARERRREPQRQDLVGQAPGDDPS